GLDHDVCGSNRSKIMNVIDSHNLERVAGGKPLHTLPHPDFAKAGRIFASLPGWPGNPSSLQEFP
ncbi:MAG: hypothetical protein AB7O60_03075, partial [Variibacter sp.]